MLDACCPWVRPGQHQRGKARVEWGANGGHLAAAAAAAAEKLLSAENRPSRDAEYKC